MEDTGLLQQLLQRSLPEDQNPSLDPKLVELMRVLQNGQQTAMPHVPPVMPTPPGMPPIQTGMPPVPPTGAPAPTGSSGAWGMPGSKYTIGSQNGQQ